MNIPDKTVIEDRIKFLKEIVEESPDRYELGRVFKAILLIREGNTSSIIKYETTIFKCLCPDMGFRGMCCKHRIEVMLITGLFV